jgi:hypothetical protein
MLIGNQIPENLKRALDNHGIEYKEIKIATLVEFLENKEDITLLNYVIQDEPLNTKKLSNSKITSHKILDYEQKTIVFKSKGGVISPIKRFLSKQLKKINKAKIILNKDYKGNANFFIEDRYSLQSRLNLLSPELRNYFIEFHKHLVSKNEHQMPPPKTNNRGITYFATKRNVFIWVEFNKSSISLNFCTGGESISGLHSTMWRTAGDGNGGRFYIRKESDIEKAVEFAKFAYHKMLNDNNK